METKISSPHRRSGTTWLRCRIAPKNGREHLRSDRRHIRKASASGVQILGAAPTSTGQEEQPVTTMLLEKRSQSECTRKWEGLPPWSETGPRPVWVAPGARPRVTLSSAHLEKNGI